MMNNFVSAVIIVHGQSEYALMKAIKSKLRLNIEVVARDKGRSSIQITALPGYFKNREFKNVRALTNHFPTIRYQKHQLIGCRIFTIMDVDDCEDVSVRQNYIEGHISGLGRHELQPYITPIYCLENFEDVLQDIGFEFVAKTNREKHQYIQVFGANGVIADVAAVEKLMTEMAQSKKTNLDVLLKYCLEQRPRF
ncbi:hypothetical protein RA086_11140 [Lactiplantibacillus sp. WILCCON 0030]|uniref:Uncharacterized protein n=1 Tax=Lactiplantibacillus brownii TaxID=3069269 RepID=A0ABU1AB25_9LACO|nr:hypothetical protein [Lactiplantibacillus brownii]MDQ7938162.1 hypothetical protein [Lactiplantibacillus brownii]